MENVPSLFSTKHRLTSSDTERGDRLKGIESRDFTRSIKAKVSKDRYGTVEKPSIAKGSHVKNL